MEREFRNDTKKTDKESLVPSVLERLIEFKDFTGISVNAFVESIGMEYVTVLNQFNKKRGLSLETVLNTLVAYNELSSDWLLRGRGDMIVSQSESNIDGVEKKYHDRVESLIDTIQLLNDTIKNKNQTIEALKEELTEYKSNKKKA